MMDGHSPRWADAAHTLIDLIVTHPQYGEIPFTASPDDSEPHGRDLFERAMAGEFGAVADYVAPSVDLGEVITAALSAIDAAAGAARARYITVTGGQAETYILKAQQAAAYAAAGYSGAVPALVQVEADVTGQTPQQAADAILAQQAAWEAKGADIERARRAGKIAVGAAADAATVAVKKDQALAALKAL